MNQQEEPFVAEVAEQPAIQWGVLEMYGHIKHAGKISEENRFGTVMGRIDVPLDRGCTEVSDRWCPLCGTCCCKTPEAGLDDVNCPLHSDASQHGMTKDKWQTIYFGGASIFRLTPCDEATARAVALQSSPAPISRHEMPKQLTHTEICGGCGRDKDECECPYDDRDGPPF